MTDDKLDEIAETLFGFFASRGCTAELCDRPNYRVLDVSCRTDRYGLLHIYYGCFPSGTPDAECMREVVTDLAHTPSGRFEGRPVMKGLNLLGLGGIRSLEELEIKLAVMRP